MEQTLTAGGCKTHLLYDWFRSQLVDSAKEHPKELLTCNAVNYLMSVYCTGDRRKWLTLCICVCKKDCVCVCVCEIERKRH